MTEPLQPRRRRVALRKAWRTFSWMVLRPTKTPPLSRRAWFGIALREARCGLMSGGEHSWGPLVAEYEGQRWRRRKCRWCRASMTPGSEMERNPFTEEEARKAEQFMPTGPPSDEQVARALKIAEQRGFYRDGKFLWER